ncbi:MarR family transcriptional regulator [Nonomuraea sp. SMC257]|uniref:MarR family transcriptional regulator n=1 Tax=Nonomuraea montanisoli TaxID=2741721 RepID=A0A7Y6I789_9ACTN|nr:MarR family transcriptional regulator [Nonomuraea montanisoli]
MCRRFHPVDWAAIRRDVVGRYRPTTSRDDAQPRGRAVRGTHPKTVRGGHRRSYGRPGTSQDRALGSGTVSDEDGARDAIDVILEQWRRERPDLDLSPMGVFGRLAQAARVVEASVDEVFTRHGLRPGEFDVLAALRRSGPPYTMIPSELSAVLMMSRAGMTNRLDRLEAAELVERSLDPADRRSFRVTLTPEGRRVIDAALTDHAANLARLASSLGPGDTEALGRILRSMLAGGLAGD